MAMARAAYVRGTQEQRFWAKVATRTSDECWEWTASLNESGYGYFQTGDGCVLAHRVAWEFAHGAIPSGDGHGGTCVLHHGRARLSAAEIAVGIHPGYVSQLVNFKRRPREVHA